MAKKTKEETYTPAEVLLLRAYANGEVNGGSMRWEDVDLAFDMAVKKCPKLYKHLVAIARKEAKE